MDQKEILLVTKVKASTALIIQLTNFTSCLWYYFLVKWGKCLSTDRPAFPEVSRLPT